MCSCFPLYAFEHIITRLSPSFFIISVRTYVMFREISRPYMSPYHTLLTHLCLLLSCFVVFYMLLHPIAPIQTHTHPYTRVYTPPHPRYKYIENIRICGQNIIYKYANFNIYQLVSMLHPFLYDIIYDHSGPLCIVILR